VASVGRHVSALIGRARPPLVAAVLVAAVLVAGHDTLYLVTYGPGEVHHALAASGHGVPWTGICLAALMVGGAVALVAVQRSHRLNARLRQIGAPPVRRVSTRHLARRIASLWLPLLIVSLLVFAVQENIEHVAHHGGHLPLLEVWYLGEYQWTVPIFALVALAAAALGAATTAHLRVLAEAVRRWEARRAPRPGGRIRLPDWSGLRHSHVPAPYQGRAPPPVWV
jgi:hypothetical protein